MTKENHEVEYKIKKSQSKYCNTAIWIRFGYKRKNLVLYYVEIPMLALFRYVVVLYAMVSFDIKKRYSSKDL